MTRFKNIFFLAILLLAAWLIGQRLWTIRSERNAKIAAANEKAASAARLEPSLATIHAWQSKPDQKCADAALGSRISPDGEPWFTYVSRSADGNVVEAMSRAPTQIRSAELMVGLREDRGRSTLVVLDVETGQPLCWLEAQSPLPASAVNRISTIVHVRD